MDKMRDLVTAIRRRADRLKKVASACAPREDSLVLQVRADEAERCAAAIERVLIDMKGVTQ